MKRPRRPAAKSIPAPAATVLDELVRTKSGPEFRAYWAANKAAILKALAIEKGNRNQ